MDKLVPGILAALVVAGIPALVVLYGNVGRAQDALIVVRREMDVLQRQTGIYGEAVARLEERIKCRP